MPQITKVFKVYDSEGYHDYPEFFTPGSLQEVVDAIKNLYTNPPKELESKEIELKSASLFWYNTDMFCTWEFNFTGHGLGVGDIQSIFLEPIYLAWDMNGIDQTFDHIAITHDRGNNIDRIKIQITVWS